MNISEPIFKNKLSRISWKKIYVREYGVSYSEGAILLLSPKFRYHFPNPSVETIVIPEGNNSAFYIDADSWMKLVNSLNKKYTTNAMKLKKYEEDFTSDGEAYLSTARKINAMNLNTLSNSKLKKNYMDYQEKLLRYSVYAWSAFILNNHVSERATQIIDKYIKQSERENEKQSIYNSLFHPQKRAAILQLQFEIGKHKKMNNTVFKGLYEKYKWLSCLDIHNDPWTIGEFKEHIKSFTKTPTTKVIPFTKIFRELNISAGDLDYLLMAQKFVYIKDARDDYRRQSVYYALSLFEEIGRRMNLKRQDVSFLQQEEVNLFLDGKIKISKKVISDRKKGFIVYLDIKNKLICIQGGDIKQTLKKFKLLQDEHKVELIEGAIACRGKVTGIVAIVKGVKDLEKVKSGNILVAVTTHPDFVPAMRKAAAIVTDEGGITSHAAIVSREFGIPCIVGTHNATKILHDDDIVIVNAEEGWVKQLKK